MEQILHIVVWAKANWGAVISFVTGAVTLFSIVAKFTPGNSDNKAADFLLQLVHALSVSPDADHARVISDPLNADKP